MVASAWSRLQAEQAAAERAAARAAKPKRKPAAKDPGQLLTITAMARYLNIHRSSLYRLMEGGLPHLRVGFTVRFSLVTVMAWLQDYTASGRRAHWSDDRPELQSQRGPTLLGPRRAAQPTDDAPTPERSAHAERRVELRRRRLINPDLEGGSNGKA